MAKTLTLKKCIIIELWFMILFIFLYYEMRIILVYAFIIIFILFLDLQSRETFGRTVSRFSFLRDIPNIRCTRNNTPYIYL